MAPKPSTRSRQPSKEIAERKQPSVEDEEEETESEPEEEVGEEEEEQKADGKHEEEEDSSSSSTEEEDDEEDGGNQTPIKTPNPPPISNSKSIAAHGDDGSDSETDSDPSPSNYKVQPISKPSTTAAKRSVQEIMNGDNPSKSNSKKLKVEGKKTAPAAPSTPGAFVRVWSNEDEVAVLNGMAEFKSLKGKSPNSDMEGFYNFIKGKLHVGFSKDQLKTKIRRMKKRFLNAAEKGESGSDPVFSNPHEDLLFKLSKKIWFGDVQDGKESKDVSRSSVRNTTKKEIPKLENDNQDDKVVVEEKKNGGDMDFWSKYPFLGMSFGNLVGNYPSLAMSEGAMGLIKDNLSLIADPKAKELDDKWKQLIAEEADLNYKMLTLMREQIKLALDK